MDRDPRTTGAVYIFIDPTSPQSEHDREPVGPPNPRVVAASLIFLVAGWVASVYGFIRLESISLPAEQAVSMRMTFYRSAAVADVALRLGTYGPIAWLIVRSWAKHPRTASLLLAVTCVSLCLDVAFRMVTSLGAETRNMVYSFYPPLFLGLGFDLYYLVSIPAFCLGVIAALLWRCVEKAVTDRRCGAGGSLAS